MRSVARNRATLALMQYSLIFYPRGFTKFGPVDASVRILSEGDLTVNALYDHYTNKLGRLKNWTYYKEILNTAQCLFVDLPAWFEQQFSDPSLDSNKRDFLVETLQFINGQPRVVNYSSWIFMFDTVCENDIKNVKFQPIPVSRNPLLKGMTSIQALQKWCEQERGIEDLLTTMYVLFGRAGRTPV